MKKENINNKVNNKLRVVGVIVLCIALISVSISPSLASSRMPGVEKLVGEITGSPDTEKFTVLEIIPDTGMGEIGYSLADGIGPYFDDYLADKMREAVANSTSLPEARKAAYASLVDVLQENRICAPDNATEAEKEDYAVYKTITEEYKEVYFENQTPENEDWYRFVVPKDIEEEIALKGNFVEVETEYTGSYVLDKDMYGNNIVVGYENSDTNGTHKVTFNQYGLETEVPAEYLAYGAYDLYDNGTEGYEADDYYIKVGMGWVDNTKYYIGTIQKSSTGNYIPINKYKYTSATNGDYDFVSSEEENQPVQSLIVGEVYYNLNLVSNDWFRTKVLGLSKTENEAEYNNFNIEIVTMTAEELAASPELTSYADMLYICGDTKADPIASTYAEIKANNIAEVNDINYEIIYQLISRLQSNDLAVIVDSTALATLFEETETIEQSNIYKLAVLAMQENIVATETEPSDWEPLIANAKIFFDNNEGDSVKKQVYCHGKYEDESTGRLLDKEYNTTFDQDTIDLGFLEIKNFIADENLIRPNEPENNQKLPEEISVNTVIQYIISISVLDKIVLKSKLKVLEIEPFKSSVVDKAKVLEWAEKLGLEEEDISVDTMTSSEFIGKINDLNEKYDLIYLGLETGNKDTDNIGETLYNDSHLNGKIYLHTGDVLFGARRLLGMMETPTSNYSYGHDYKKDGSDKVVISPIRWLFWTDYVYESNYNNMNLNRGTLRFSGNDITKAKGKDLIEFVNAGYPVILDEKFDNNNSKGKSYLDTASNAYSMYQAIKDENNVFYADQFTGSSSDTTKESLKKYLVKPKLNINGIELGIPRIEDEHQYLDYKFTISNDLELDSSTRYFADIFFDLNTDGRYTKETELQSDVIYLNSDGEAIEPDENGKCLLKSNEAYTVRKELPNTYSGPLAWKLLVSINGENIHTSLSDCSEINLELGEGKVINILQIVPNTGNTLDLANKLNSGTWHNELSEMGYNMHIKKITASYFSSNYNNEFETGRRLKDYDMLILGFGNRWQEISDPKAVNKINEYIESGKSVLFTHDTTSYCNVDDEAEISTIFDASDYWGYHVNSILRQRLGLDRYGINTWDIANSKYNDVAVELRRAQIINNPDNYSSKIKSTNDKAYVVDNLNSTYPETQGYTNPTLDNLNASNLRSFISDIFGTNNPFGNKTFYYSLRADSGVKIGGTRVWDKLLDLINLIFDSGSDMINSGHQMYINQINSGQLTRFPYNLEGENGELTSINIEPTHFQSYQIDMDNIDSNGNSDIVVWYTIGGEKNETGTEVSTPYSASPNDVRNNYYIYSKGNVMYSGAGHSTIKTNTNSKEFKLFLNTMIAAYRLGLQNPNVTILNNKNRDSGSRGVAYFAYDSDNAGEPVNGTSDIYFTVNNPNLNITDSVTTVKYSDENGVIHNVKTYRVTSDGDKVLTDNKVISGRVYRAELPKSLSKYLENNSGEINVSIENTFKHYGEAGTLNADAELMLTRFTLKELQ